MIKKIRITNHSEIVVRNTTIGKVYDVTFHKEGMRDAWGHISLKDSLCFRDDVGDKVPIWTCDSVYEVVEEEPASDIKEDNWNTVNWDEIPEDVEAVVTFNNMEDSYFKHINGVVYSQAYRSCKWGEDTPFGTLQLEFGDRFHLCPTPTIQPTPEPPESTQVESSEVEAATTPEFDWSSVDEDVEAVIIYEGECTQLLKTVEGILKYRKVGELEYTTSCWYSTLDEREKCISHYKDGTATLLRRPPATTPPEDIGLNAAYDIYKKVAAEVDKIGVSSIQTETYTPKPPSISTILQEAQQSILKHHGVTGKVKFTVTCS